MSDSRLDRLDRVLVARGLCRSRTEAQALVMAGKVRVDGLPRDKPGTRVAMDAELHVEKPSNPFVSRGGLKLRGALDCFEPMGLSVVGKVAMDVGASTGGFTDCLLQAGVRRVHAIDVGYGQLAWKLVCDQRVVVHDRQNIRHLEPSSLGEAVQLAVVDCSFIGLAKVLPAIPPFLTRPADVVALVKPQFELDRGRVGKGGIVRDQADREEALERAVQAGLELGFCERGRCEAAIAGRDGNREYLLWLTIPA